MRRAEGAANFGRGLAPPSPPVIAGLDPAIHSTCSGHFASASCDRAVPTEGDAIGMDGRVKPGHDGSLEKGRASQAPLE